jgi:predicted DNA-binding transcriptional regulator AlpA
MTQHDLLSSLEAMIHHADQAECAALIGGLERVKALAYGKMLHREPEPSRQEDRLLTVAEASDKLGMTKDYLYRHAETFPFTVRMGAKQLRFSLNGIERYIKHRRAVSYPRLDINT